MMAFIQYTMQIIMGFLMLCMLSIMLPRAAVAADRVEEVLSSQTVIHDPEHPADPLTAARKAFSHSTMCPSGIRGRMKMSFMILSFTAEPGKLPRLSEVPEAENPRW